MSLITTPCTLVYRTTLLGSTDPFEQPVYDDYGNEQSPETTVDTVCSLQQTRTAEPGDAGELSVTLWDLFLPAGTALDTGDAVIVDSSEYEVVGAPWDANEGSAGLHHVAATLRRTASGDD